MELPSWRLEVEVTIPGEILMRHALAGIASISIPVLRFRSMITRAVLSIASLCAALGLSLGVPVPASADEPSYLPTECPGIIWFATDSKDRLFFREVSEENYVWCYIGHDEPAVNFYSTVPGSGSNMTWELILPTEGTTPTFETYIHFQLTLALCDPNSTNANRTGPCTPNSDTNIQSTAGAALLELKFIPPGEPNQGSSVGLSCSAISNSRWCAVAQVQVESTCAVANPAVLNEAWITTNGRPPQPVYAGNFSPTAPGANTFLMNPGDRIRVSLADTPNGLLIVIIDETTHTTGYVTVSSANGFQSLTPPSATGSNTAPNCQTVPFTFRPLWNTASTANIIPWALANINVQFALETGHFEIQDSDGDDSGCTSTTNPVVNNACFGTDGDFDGQPYQSGSWPPAGGGKSVQIISASGTGIGPASSNQLYPQLQFETTFRATLGSNGSMASLIGTTVGANTSFFYPYYSQMGPGFTAGIACSLVIGNYASGGANVTSDFNKQAQYDGGASNSGENAGPIIANPCPR
jgi:hypothetical protein